MSRYKNAARVLPPDLLAEVQRYAAGEQLYVPRPEGVRMGWGERNGAREALRRRNRAIKRLHREGATIDELMVRFHLGYDSVRKIVGGKNGSSGSGE
ncbi:MAG: CD3324 family protein [Bacillota bacterium]